MGINKDLKLKGNDFTNAATAFFIAYLVAEAPNGEFSPTGDLNKEKIGSKSAWSVPYFVISVFAQVTSSNYCRLQNGFLST